MSTGPSARSTSSNAGDRPGRSATSSFRANARAPSLSISALTARFFSSLRDSTATAAPARAIPRAIAADGAIAPRHDGYTAG